MHAQSCPTLRPHGPWDFPGKNTGVGCHFLLQGSLWPRIFEPVSLASPILAGRFFTMGFHGGTAGKESSCNMGDVGSIPGLGRCPGEGNSYPLQHSGLENSMDSIVHGVAKRHDWVHFTFTSSPPGKLRHLEEVTYFLPVTVCLFNENGNNWPAPAMLQGFYKMIKWKSFIKYKVLFPQLKHNKKIFFSVCSLLPSPGF